MGTKRALQEVDPLCLPVGLKVGPWRVKGWRGRGAYGTLYCVEREGHEAEGEFALKVAIEPGDERFGREAELLSRITSGHVPRFREKGVWEHPAGAFPYVVMEWVEGEALYQWAGRRNPTSRQVLRLLAQVARALEATHAAEGVHRDVKGSNVLVRPGDGRAFLTDFGAGYYRGAATLTSRLLPPGTPAYRSPEAWAFVNAFLRHPTAHYPASTCDDLFALGVTAYRLVTDEYPPPTQPGESGSEVWREDGAGPRPPRELNSRVSPALNELILRLLAVAPVERFRGRATRAAEALEQAAEREGPEADELLFIWSDEHRPRWRSRGGARLAEEQDAAAREDQAQREEEARTRAQTGREQAPAQSFAPEWRLEMAVAFTALLAAALLVAVQLRGQDVVSATSNRAVQKRSSVAVGDSASTTPSGTEAPGRANDKRQGVRAPLPDQPFPGQSKPPCKRSGEVEIRGGCWFRLDVKPPCKEEGKQEVYLWKGACYGPAYSGGREPTSSPP
ncbi:MAG TPA: serine/threonine-protein kinase [Myxococcaceae bacterium]|nr:serine/threonine-protein kinase [Myxococcaceae bacterium]